MWRVNSCSSSRIIWNSILIQHTHNQEKLITYNYKLACLKNNPVHALPWSKQLEWKENSSKNQNNFAPVYCRTHLSMTVITHASELNSMKIYNLVKVFSLTPNVCLSAVKGWTLCVLQACVLSAPTQGSSLNVASRHLQKGRADKDIDQPSEGELLMLHYFLLIPRYANARKKERKKTSPTYLSNCFFVQNLI